ncbi:MAG TPA: sigma-54 dependent transcriptional regulator [Candidatus Baltobacteraceae bacterium]|jgi:DNA-binding NtrC family response regulator|nr:sigma-54 dependent transcriptional regulator [Candidatus Baltobacteraceae bacterium]
MYAAGAEPVVAVQGPLAINVLIVEDEDATRNLCRDVVIDAGLHARMAATTEEALDILEQHPVDIVITDLRIPQMGGLELLKHVREVYPQTAVMVLTQYGTIESAVEATRMGAADYVTKPFHIPELRGKLDRVVRLLEVDQENRILREQLRSRPGFGGLIGTSTKMQRVYRLIEKVSKHNYPVLILGESGTGKELVARSIHFSGSRRNKPFVPVDCSALVPTLIESELFGYVKGAFTGAMHAKTGLMEAAGSGTLFLDEIGDMPVDLQAKLLRAIQEKEVKPVGSTDRVSIAVRVIAATNRDLETAVRQGQFRQDLFFRLNVVQVRLPPLRERKSDIPLLVNAFLEKFSEAGRVRAISEEAMARLIAYDWPGNIRELENAIERAVALGSGPILHVGDLPSSLHYATGERMPRADELMPLEELERRAILRALREAGGDKLAAARLLGIGKTTLYRKLKQYETESHAQAG